MTLAFFRHALWLFLLFIAPLPQAKNLEPAPGAFLVLNYHDIPDDVRSQPDRYSLDAGKLVREFAWLSDQGYHPVSLEQIIAAREGGAPLPPKAVLLTFDDGYRSFYTRVFPLLKLFHFPAVLAVVGSWLEVPEGQFIAYDTVKFPRSHFMSWEQLREVSASGLVEIASHSFDLHHGVLANPQGNKQPAMVTQIYDPVGKSYETDDDHQRRLRRDLARNASLIESRLGKRPRILVWPYGRYNEQAVEIARSLGMPYTFTLEEGFNGPETPLSHVKRTIIELNPSLENFAGETRNLIPLDPIRSFHVELDAIYSPDPEVQEQKLSQLIERIAKTKASQVYLQAFSDPDGDGVADALYFPNRYLPMRSDLFNRAAWQIATRGGARVFARMPVFAFRLPPSSDANESSADKTAIVSQSASLDHDAVVGIYEDMARSASFDGILFDEPGGFSGNRQQTDVVFTHEIIERCQYYRAPLKAALTISLEAGLAAPSDKRFAGLLPAYDHVVIPFSLGSKDPAPPYERLDALVSRIAAIPKAQEKIELEFHGLNGPLVEGEELASFMPSFALSGLRNFGFHSDEFAADSPTATIIHPYFSLQAFPRSLPRETFR
ncbi:MAG: poly-beta-1,6-N-acetyl-D-glucosamine N-deacetylase PgaB [Methylococcaceae bacterium]|nr:poly-beta-1,6-N-acetyl-D-glucosamine N-deacetylase PgaB [Methylococcaceae bacterium]